MLTLPRRRSDPPQSRLYRQRANTDPRVRLKIKAGKDACKLRALYGCLGAHLEESNMFLDAIIGLEAMGVSGGVRSGACG